jgi:4-amino-4-deoxy-L-arabinose transferase-like glycosyltransferase
VPEADYPPGFRGGWWWLIAWGVLVAVALAARPLLPVDETRYMSVAWEMWRQGNWLVPSLNGAPYSDKPPLLFWCILMGWRVLGVSEWWARLLSPLFTLVSALLLLRLSRRLSGESSRPVHLAVPFMSGALWVTYSTLVLFDMLLTACVLVALSGVVEAFRGNPVRGWLAYGAGVGLGALAKGPVVLVHALPVALLAPWWAAGSRPAGWRRWYLCLIAALLLGAAIGFAWALAAGSRGGPAYEGAILWKQTAGRMANAFAHQRPWWWYLPLVPLVLFPWGLWPPLWASLAGMRRGSADLSSRFALACIVPATVVLSLISSKQVHYLMPLLPPFALLAAGACARVEGEARRWDTLVPAVLLAGGGAVLLTGAVPEASDIAPGWGVILLIGALLVGLPRPRREQIVVLSLVSPLLLIGMHLAGMGLVRRFYDLRPSALILKRAEESGQAIGYVGRYDGQFHFLGRLERPIDEVAPEALPRWMSEHSNALVIRCQRSRITPTSAVFAQPYRDGLLSISEVTSPTLPRP